MTSSELVQIYITFKASFVCSFVQYRDRATNEDGPKAFVVATKNN